MQITFLQTADTIAYREMLEVTSKTFIAYCGLHGFDYQMHLGIIRGIRPWHAALNRIPLLQAFEAGGYGCWVIYADADAYVADLQFDIGAYLEDKHSVFMAASQSGFPGAPWWEINNGVFALNFAHPLTGAMLSRWRARIDEVSDERLFQETAWGEAIDDQHALHLILQETPEAQTALFLDNGAILNADSRFLPQLMRDPGKHTLASRVATLRTLTDAVLKERRPTLNASPDEHARLAVHEAFVDAVYQVVFGRTPDPGGREHVLRVLSSGERSLEQELRTALSSEEARAYMPEMIEAALGPGSLQRLAQAAARLESQAPKPEPGA